MKPFLLLFSIISTAYSVPMLRSNCTNGYSTTPRRVVDSLADEISRFTDALNPKLEFGADYKTVAEKNPCWNQQVAAAVEADFHRKPTLAGKNPQYDLDERLGEVDINTEIHDALFQGDIVLLPDQSSILDSQLSDSTDAFVRKVIAGISNKWDLPIKYTFHESIGKSVQSTVDAAIKFWEANTCVTFQHMEKPTGDYLKFYKGTGCFSTVGRAGGQQGISLGQGCNLFGIVVHEIGHSLGFWHEQSRYDRNDNLQVNYDNIKLLAKYNYVRHGEDKVESYNTPYDFGSIMHYSPTSFASNRSIPTLVSIDPQYQQTMGQRITASFIDVHQINQHYGCLDKCSKFGTYCKNGGYSSPKDCKICICPDGFAGRTCEQLPASDSQGEVLIAEAGWKNLNFILTYPTKRPNLNYWHITAPKDHLIELRFGSNFRGTCIQGCYYDYIEVKLSDWQRVGYRYCCDAPTDTVLVSEGNLVVLIARVKNWLVFELEYRFVPKVTEEENSGDNYGDVYSSTIVTTTTQSSLISTTTGPSQETDNPPIYAACEEWAEWSSCSRTCGGCGIRTRSTMKYNQCQEAGQHHETHWEYCNSNPCELTFDKGCCAPFALNIQSDTIVCKK